MLDCGTARGVLAAGGIGPPERTRHAARPGTAHLSPGTATDAVPVEPIDAVPRPVLDGDGLLRFRGRWTAIPDRQLAVVALLTARYGQLVRSEEVAQAYASSGGTVNADGIRLLIKRIRDRIGQIGLQLHVVRGRGVVLDADEHGMEDT